MKRFLPFLLLVLSFGLANDPADTPNTPMAPFSPLEVALLRVANLSFGVASADIYLLMEGQEDVVLSAAYGDVSHYLELPAGEYDLVVSDRDTAMRLMEGTVGVTAGYSHTLVVGSLSEAETTASAGPTFMLYEDHFPLFPVDTAGLRIIHAAAGLGPVDVFVGGERVFAGAQPLEASDYEAFAPGELAIELRLGDVDTSLGSYTVPLEAASFHTLFIYGEGGSELLLSNERPVARAD